MTLLVPLGLVGLASVPVLVWLWRFAASRHQTVLPSLVPFEHLLRRPPTRRTQLLVNLLFWLQAAALLLASLALAEPVLLTARTKTVLVLLDTSASMAASVGGPSPFQRATRALSARLARKGPGERFFVVGTAPVRAITEAPSSDAIAVQQRLARVSPSDMTGNLAVARRIGQALLGTAPDEILVLTDEPPPERHDPAVTFQSFHEPLPNAAIIGVDAHEPLCGASEARVLVTIQNAADAAQDVAVTATLQGRTLTKRSQSVEANGRAAVTVPVPEEASGLLEITIRARHDALAVDNHATALLRGSAPIPTLVASERAEFVETIGQWLQACPRIAWTPVSLPARAGSLPTAPAEAILVTDQSDLLTAWRGEAIVFARGEGKSQARLTQWLIDASHPVGEYLDPLETVATAVAPSHADAQWGDPIIWGLANGQRVPLVRAASLQGRRTVGILADPTAGAPSVPLVLVFFNGMRWVAGSTGLVTAGEPVTVGPFEPGTVRVQRPDGAVAWVAHPGGLLRYDDTERAGRYRFSQGGRMLERLVNMLDPVESNTMTRLSTWGTEPVSSTRPARPQRIHHPLTTWLLGLLALVLAVEWGLYLRRGRRR